MWGKAQVKVINGKSGRVLREYPEQRNLILNNGMDMVATTAFVDCFSRAVLGTGTTPTVDDSGLTQASQTGTTVTISGGAFNFTSTAVDAGKMIKWDSGAEARIVTVTSVTVAEVANSATVASGEFRVYRTNQSGLASESKRSSTYLTGSANCGSVWTGASVAHKRTYDFTSEVGSVTYNEIGFSNTSSAGNNLFSRILLAAGVSLVAGQAVRLVYTLTMVLSPSTATVVGTSPITGWATATGVTQLQWRFIQNITSSGTIGTGDEFNSSCCEPSSYGVGSSSFPCVILSSSSAAHNTFGTAGPTRTALVGSFNTSLLVLSAYTALSFYREKAFTFSVSQGNFSTIRSIMMCETNEAGNNQSLVYIIDSNQTKDNVHTLTITFRITWTRVLA